MGGMGMKGAIAGKKKVSKLMKAKDTDSVGETGAESDATEGSSETDSKKSYFELQSYKTRTTDIYEFHDYREDNRFLPGWKIKGCFDKPNLVPMNVHHDTSGKNCAKLCHGSDAFASQRSTKTCLCYPKDTSHADVSRNFHTWISFRKSLLEYQPNPDSSFEDELQKLITEKQNPNCNFTSSFYYLRRDDYSTGFRKIVEDFVDTQNFPEKNAEVAACVRLNMDDAKYAMNSLARKHNFYDDFKF